MLSRKTPPLEEYEGHLNRIIQMKYENPKSHNHSIYSLQKNHIEKRKVRLKTEGDREKKQVSKTVSVNNRNPRVDLPLVPQHERALVGKIVESCHLENHQNTLLLKNYLLSRRILHATPSINFGEFKKSFKKHEQYANLRSRGRLQTVNQSQSRLERYKTFELKREKMEKSQQRQGKGRFVFSLHLKKIHTIIRHHQQGKLYNLLLKLGSKSYKYTLLSPNALKQVHYFNFKKKQAQNTHYLDIKLYMISKNDTYEYGQFEIDVIAPFRQISELSKYKDYEYELQNQIGSLKSIKNGKIVGTDLKRNALPNIDKVIDFQIDSTQLSSTIFCAQVAVRSAVLLLSQLNQS